jgi:ATP-dependent Clp protease adapter protein ClpS
MTIQLLPDILEQGPGTGSDDYVVIVFNNDTNTYDEVMDILMRATGCTSEEAWIETWEVDNLGKSVVHHANQEECERAASVIRTIGIKVEVRQE